MADTGVSTLDRLRTAIARIERGSAAPERPVLPFGVGPLDAALPRGGLALGVLHEVFGAGAEHHGTAAALFAAGIVARLPGTVLWVLEQGDLFAPGLAGAGLHPDRVVYAEAGQASAVLLVMEEGLRHPGLAGVVGEVAGRLTLTASRRLQLAAEGSGVTAIAVRREDGRGPHLTEDPTAAVTRWRVSALPAGPPLPHAPTVPGVGRGAWRLELLRSRGGRTGSWVVGACDEAGCLGMAAALADGPAAEAVSAA